MQGVILYETASCIIFENNEGLSRLTVNLRAYDIRIGDSVWFHPVSEGLAPLTHSEIDSVWMARERLEWTEKQFSMLPSEFLKDDPLRNPSKHISVSPPASVFCETYTLSPNTTPIFKINKYLATIGRCYEPDNRRMERAGTKAFYQVGFVDQILQRFKTIEDAYKRLSEFSVSHLEFDRAFLSAQADPLYISRPIYVTEERHFFKWWYREVVERGVRLYNLEPKEIYKTGYSITEIGERLWNKPHMLLGIEDGVLGRLQNTLRINTSEGDLQDRKLLKWVDSTCAERKVLGVTLSDVKKSYPKDIPRLMNLIGEDLEVVMIPPIPGRGTSAETPLIMTRNRYLMSKYISDEINRIKNSSPMYTAGDIAIKDRKLDATQRDAVRLSLTRNVHIITGPAGSGKTTIIRSIAEHLDKWDKRWLLLAFTGIATYNMRKKVSTDKASTIDLLLSQLKRKHGISDFRKLNHIIIDEASMVSTVTMKRLLHAMKEYGVRARITLIGDPNQLPPVGAGIFFETLINYNLVSMTKLEVVHRTRNEPDNVLYLNSSAIADGKEELEEGDEFIMTVGSEAMVFNTVRAMLDGGYKPTEIKVLCPYREVKQWVGRGNLEKKMIIEMLNRGLQNIMNPKGRQVPGTGFRVGDQVMVSVNDHKRGVFNGSQGIITAFDNRNITVDFEDTSLTYSLAKKLSSKDEDGERKATHSISDLMLSYALTVHKAQGMEWPIVLLYIPPNSKPSRDFLNRRLLYTAVTRAKDTVVVVSESKRVVNAIVSTAPSEKWDPIAIMGG